MAMLTVPMQRRSGHMGGSGTWAQVDEDLSIWNSTVTASTNGSSQSRHQDRHVKDTHDDTRERSPRRRKHRSIFRNRREDELPWEQSQNHKQASSATASASRKQMVVDLTTEDPTAMDIDADPIPSERSRKRRTVATAPLKRSRSERIQHIRDDYHAASPTDLMAEGERSYVASPVLTPSSCGSSASFADRTQHEASPAPEQDSTAADFSLALALQQEEEERMRNNWGFRLSDETQDDIGDGSTLHDAEVAAYLHEQEEALRMKMSKPQMRMCVICSDEMHPLDFPAKPPSRECTHTVNTCTNCLEKWVATDLDGRGWERISCPECGCALDHNDIHRAAAPDVFARYDQLATRGVLGADEHFHWCINAGCTSGQIHDDLGGESPVFACATCGFRQCIKHRMAWHDGETCEQYDYRVSGRADADRRAKEDQASEAAAAATTQTCPKATCKAKIQKSDGCDHMSCTRCGTQFCYICGADYAEIRRNPRTGHKQTCKYYNGGYPH